MVEGAGCGVRQPEAAEVDVVCESLHRTDGDRHRRSLVRDKGDGWCTERKRELRGFTGFDGSHRRLRPGVGDVTGIIGYELLCGRFEDHGNGGYAGGINLR